MVYYRVRHKDYHRMVKESSFRADPWCDLADRVRALAAVDAPAAD